MKKQIFSLLLCLVLILCLIPLSAEATTEISSIALSGLRTPEVGQTSGAYSAFTTATPGVSFHGVDWEDKTAGRFMEGSDKFVAGHTYSVQIWVEAKSGYAFKCANDNTPTVSATVDGKTMKVSKAFEYKAFAMVVLSYDFSALAAPEESHTHTPSAWRVTQVYHYKACTTCGDFLEQEDHKPNTPTSCADAKVCTICGYDYGERGGTHTPSDWRTNQVYHYKACTTCGDFLEQEDHKGGTATCKDPAVCTVCGFAYKEPNENHTPDTVWTACGELYHAYLCKLCGAHCNPQEHRWSPRYHAVDAKGHAYQCADCKGYSKLVAHNPGPAATADTPQTCKDCDFVMAPALNHTHELTPVKEVAPTCTEPGANAYYACKGCNQRFTDAEGKTLLEELTIPPQGHQISNGWSHNADTHWRVCAVCDAKMIETEMKHELQGGKCSTCDHDSNKPAGTEPAVTEPKAQKDAFPWWGIALIGLGAVAAGVGTGLLILKTTKKKKEGGIELKKILMLWMCLLLLCTLTLPALAAGDAPQITMQPQNYNYPQYSTATYTVKASGNNLHATWYLEYEGQVYNLSDNTNGIEPWEGYAGETYGPLEEGPNTFTWFFGGIEEGLAGAQIWCVIEDGHYDVTSQRAFITVQGAELPPQILDVPAAVSAYRGDEATIRCVAKSVSDAQLAFQWYETATGKLQDIRAIDGQDSDFLICNTEAVGTRYYVCCVTSTAGGTAYSSVIPVTVAEPAATTPPTTAQTTPPTEPATTAPTTAPQTPPATTPGTTPAPVQTQTPDQTEFPWWGIALIALGGVGLGAGITLVLSKSKKIS